MTAVGIVSTILEDLIASIKDSSTEYFFTVQLIYQYFLCYKILEVFYSTKIKILI